MSAATITLIVLGLTVVVFVLDRLPVAVVAVAVALVLWATGVLELGEALAGFGDPPVLFIAALFVVSEGLDAAGVTSWVGEQAMARIGESRVRLLVVVMLMVAALTAIISVNGAVAALIPVTVVMAIRSRRPPSTFSCLLPSPRTPGRSSCSPVRRSTSSSRITRRRPASGR